MSRIGDDLIAAAKRVIARRQEVVTNNLANASTTGFKGERVFARLLAGAQDGTRDARSQEQRAGDPTPVAYGATDLRPGTLEPTSRPLDLGLDGPGFFVVTTPQGERLTRGGSFELAPDGTVVDGHGNALLGEVGPVVIPPASPAGGPAGAPVVDGAGAVRVDGRLVGRLRVEDVPDGTALQHEQGGLFVPPATRQRRAEVTGVRQGVLESSNVNTLASLVELITIQRVFGALEQADSVTEALDQHATKLGKPLP